MSDFPSTDEAFHEPGAQLAEAEAPASPTQNEFRIVGLAKDFETFHRQMEEARQREADERAAAGTGGANGAPATEPDAGSPEYQAANAEARQIAVEQAAEGSVGQGMAHATDPPPGSSDYQTAEEEARKLEKDPWKDLGFFAQLSTAFERFDQENKKGGATFNVDSAARRLETVVELQRRQVNGEELNVTEKKYLLRNRNVAADLAHAVARLVDAQHSLDELPVSAPLRQLFEAKTVAEAGRLLREHPGEIARAIGIESVPSLTVSLIAMAALGSVGGAVALTGTGGLDGYAKGLVGALTRAGIDISNADDLTRALQDKELMERARKDATTEGAIEAGATAAAMMIGIRRSRATKSTRSSGIFSISDWSGYPTVVPRPQGPFRIVQGAEYAGAYLARKKANAAFRRAQGLGQSVEVHEIHPVKFGGSPTDPANKMVVPRDVHRQQVTPWWNKLQKHLGY